MLSFSSDDTAPGATLRVHVASGDTLDVRRFDVEERMSSLFRIDLVAVSDNPDIDFDAVVARPARFAIHGGSRGSRAWTGVSSSLQQVAAAPRGLSTYHLRIVPDLWLATQRRNYRVFQQLPELDIVLQLLGEWGVPADVRVDRGAQKRREYRVQYGESDYTFICRMLEDAGVSFHFEQGDDGSRLVLADAPQAAEPRAAALPFKDHPTAADREYVTAVRTGKEVRPGRVTVRDHDFRRPPSVPLVASAAAQADGVSGRLESYHYIPGAFLFGAAAGGDSPAADDRGASRADEAEAARIAARRLDAERGGAAATFFETNALDLAPGVVMSMLDHPRADLGDGRRLLVVASRLQGEFNQEWKLEHEARSAAIPHHPPPSTPRPRAAGAESATVVGPAGEEIHCDEFGRVRVQFHWDREGRMDEKSSSWIHVSQPWSGGGFGGINLPRVGQEVLVEFLGGDPDRPVIVGRLYNNVQKVPYKLPENRTRSGWKSQSTGKGGGYNEIMFEDAAGRELLRVQAERDLSKLVKRDESITVGHDRAKIVQNDEIVTIGRDRAKIVKNDETSIVERDRRRIVKNDETVT
ncbi:MAG: type VI secretion system tip protein VgrG, partial [Polyangiaceae bacterium]|nr:type VI secretion system tip protein VgrG [Polyangiaceae bacterium]